MADLKWPVNLRGPLVESYSREEIVGFRESSVAAGPSYVEPFTEDAPIFHNVTYQFHEGDARRFQLWLKENRVRFLSPVFDGPIVNEERLTSIAECRFTADGYPQLTGKTSGGVYTYSARLITRQIDSIDIDYAEQVESIWHVSDGYIGLGGNKLDEGLNL